MLVPHTLHKRATDANRLSHRTRAPVSRAARRWVLGRLAEDLSNDLGILLAPATMRVPFDSSNPQIRKPRPLQSDGLSQRPQVSGDVLIEHAVCRQQDDHGS